MKRSLYLDTNVIVALIEAQEAEPDSLWMFMNRARATKIVSFHTSALSFSELLVKPYRSRDEGLVRQYLQLAKSDDWLAVHQVAPTVIELAAVLRASTRLRLPDAIHVATAMLADCDDMLTFDVGITSLPQLQHPISGKPIGQPIEVVRPDEASLRELIEALL